MAPKKPITTPQPNAAGDKHSRFDLVPIDAPRLSHKRYDDKDGYARYLTDYNLYRQALLDYKLQGIGERTKKVLVEVNNQEAGKVTLAYELLTTPGQFMAEPKDFAMVSPSGRECGTFLPSEIPRWMYRSDKQSARNLDGKTAGQIEVGDELVLTRSAGNRVQQQRIRVRSKTVVGQVNASFAEKVKAKGPATTPKKVRTPEEIAERAAKEATRKANLKWKKEHEVMLSRAKLEEKLAKSALTRSVAIKKADGGVETEVDLDGWRVITKARREKTRERIKEVAVAGGSTITKTYTKS